MRCLRCGNEFGNGNNCQHCGVDKVTGLANLSGYNGNQGTYHSQNGFQQAPTTTACYSCGNIIPANSQFCPVCGIKLLVTCPKCGYEYSSQYPICNKCGTNRNQYLKEREERERRRIAEEAEAQRERKYYEEAMQINKEINSDGIAIFVIGVLLSTAFITILALIALPIVWFILICFLGILLLAWATEHIFYSMTKRKIDDWKRKHPNDPRGKYL